ncbi:MAG: hypothetical protein L3J69_12840 [Desulfobacula sp.]|nr:hypothetical protein [Desulfobacula sp.]
MIPSLSTEFWIEVLFIINFFVVVFLFLIVKRMNRLSLQQNSESDFESDLEEDSVNVRRTSGSAVKIMELLEPLVTESRNTAISFESQIKEKKRLIKELNEALDARIISINLLLSRADAQQKKLEDRQSSISCQQTIPDDFVSQVSARISQQVSQHASLAPVDDQQNQILDLYNRNIDIDSIAQKLSIPIGEVKLVVDLKEKFVAMEKNSR